MSNTGSGSRFGSAAISEAPIFWRTIAETPPASTTIVMRELLRREVDSRFSEANRRNWKRPETGGAA